MWFLKTYRFRKAKSCIRNDAVFVYFKYNKNVEKEEIENKIKNNDFEHEDVLGDIVISIEKVEEQAKEYGHSFERELAYMAVHGFYHLMGYDHMKENKVENLIWIIFAIIGAILVVIGFILFGSVFNYNNKIETTGIITEIWSSRDSDNNRNHKVYVSYVAEGNEYESTLNGYSSSFYEGKEIEIYYDKDNPNNITRNWADFSSNRWNGDTYKDQ